MKYLKCPECKKILTEKENNIEIEYSGHNGMCMCKYMASGNLRKFVPYIEITKEEYIARKL